MTRREVMKGGAVLATGALTSAVRSGHAEAAAVPATFGVAHGAWSAGWEWKKMHPLMGGRGHRLLTPSYTGLGERAHLANSNVDLDTHITDIVNVLVYEDLRDVVLVGHSYGGMVSTGVADECGTASRVSSISMRSYPTTGRASSISQVRTSSRIARQHWTGGA
jgi:pimeloyl-ACP methyl ester carboxylesterase